MTESERLLGPLIQSFFAEHLTNHKRASVQTIASYRDTFRLFLKFFQQCGIEPSALRFKDIGVPGVLKFLDHLEQNRQNSARSRNLRLATIRTFFRFAALHDPECVDLASRILAIPVKRCDRKLVGHLTHEEVESILATPDLSTWKGRRDYVLLLTLYNTGARVSELISLVQTQIQFGSCNYLTLQGKGRKQRAIPLWPKTSRVLQSWFRELQTRSICAAFPNSRGRFLSRDGVEYILKLAVNRATITCSTLASKRISPHILRHTTAMHLLQSGVDIAVIALWLGHESIETTHMYMEADLLMKEKALEKTAPPGVRYGRFKADEPLLRFLATL